MDALHLVALSHDPHANDTPTWTVDDTGVFFIKTAYKLSSYGPPPNRQLWTTLWLFKGPQR